ncbi:MAG: hypothetical protein CML04_08300 [Pseudozobellia sp.]|nr:hypothetical protein [Pseudozobellia sp.]MBG50737.1 hypothetical protein [Pseudozobellia sp.]|tara:strand:- start:1709 stop:2458 length:750 start_codon:yes stop_codon:yes gene_type:complete
MKNSKLSLSLISYSLIAFTLLSCVTENKTETDCPDCPCTVADDNYNNGIILPEQARKLYLNYEKRRVSLIQDYEDEIDKRNADKEQKVPKTDNQKSNNANDKDPNGARFDVARYVYYDYEDLKKYMAYIENEAKLAGEELSTLRFYFANYPDQDKFPDGKEVVHRRQNSIMMSPTVKRNDKDYIFYTDDAGEGKRRIVLLKNDFQPEGNKNQDTNSKSEASLAPSFSSAPIYAPKSTTKNEGNSAPPPY